MSNISALNRAILAGQRLQAVTDALAAFNACYLAARGSSMPSELADVLTNTERALVAHQSAMRDELDAARVVAAETRVFKLGDYYVDLPAGYEVERHEACNIRLVVRKIGMPHDLDSGLVITHEENGDDVGGFVVRMNGVLLPVLCSTEHIALKTIFAELAKHEA